MARTTGDAHAGRTVADVMVLRPATHSSTVTVAQAYDALDDPHRHLLLVVRRRLLLGTIERTDLVGSARGPDPALPLSRLGGRTVHQGTPVDVALAEMVAGGRRRLAVTDLRGELLGLLCLKASGTGFCSDEGIAARAAARDRSA
ncbi:hypothetical protein [Nocardioides sp.]|uniref:hypothetical protein n=1 Tax=Nocardioides sp. TaxID=35761 RepID=UPI0027251645|nr:hypothetical protein [Nocardioides sp.]MDO9457390.1 hypothetical protein [Nocardioides sp.]